MGGIEEAERDEVDRRGTALVVLYVEVRLALALVEPVEEVAFDMVRRESWYIGCGEGCCEAVVMLYAGDTL